MSTHIPNSFQTPNLFIDRAMEHLTDSEFRVLMFATRHIYGWQDRVEKNLAYISLKMFEDGYTTKDGQQYYGCGLSRGAIIKAVQSLVDYGLLARDGKPTEKGQAYKIGEVIDWNRLEQRTAKRRDDYQKKTVKATETRQGVTSDVPVTSHDTTKVTSDVTMQGNVARTESNTSSNTSSNPPMAGAKRQRVVNPVFNLVALKSFGISDTAKLDGQAGRIGKVTGWLKKHGATEENVTAFYLWYARETKAASPPRDVDKFVEWYVKFEEMVKRAAAPNIIPFDLDKWEVPELEGAS